MPPAMDNSSGEFEDPDTVRKAKARLPGATNMPPTSRPRFPASGFDYSRSSSPIQGNAAAFEPVSRNVPGKRL